MWQTTKKGALVFLDRLTQSLAKANLVSETHYGAGMGGDPSMNL